MQRGRQYMHRRFAQNSQVREAPKCDLTDCKKLFKNCKSLERRALHDSNLTQFQGSIFCPVEYGGITLSLFQSHFHKYFYWRQIEDTGNSEVLRRWFSISHYMGLDGHGRTNPVDS